MKLARLLASLCAAGLAACAAPAGAPQAAETRAAPLAGTRWVGVVDPSIDRRATPWIEFVGEGRITGFTGCNMLNGNWSGEGAATRLGGLVTTKRMCLGPEGEVEKRVLAAMSDQSRVSREGTRLVFTAPSGARFEFTPAR